MSISRTEEIKRPRKRTLRHARRFETSAKSRSTGSPSTSSIFPVRRSFQGRYIGDYSRAGALERVKTVFPSASSSRISGDVFVMAEVLNSIYSRSESFGAGIFGDTIYVSSGCRGKNVLGRSPDRGRCVRLRTTTYSLGERCQQTVGTRCSTRRGRTCRWRLSRR